MAEWFKAHAWKACGLARVSWVRIPPRPSQHDPRLTTPLFESLAYYHPIVVHFPIVLTFVGVGARILWIFLRREWLSHAATALIVGAALGAMAAVKTGDEAHGPVERVPGTRDLVIEHEDWGKRSRNVLIGIALLVLGALALSGARQRAVRYLSAAGGLVAMFFMHETAEHGGELVYSYAGGVGIRTTDSTDVERLLLAGLYHQSALDRKEGRASDAALDSLQAPKSSRTLYLNAAMLRADALAAVGQRDSARAVLTAVAPDYPTSTRLKAKLDSLR